MREEELLKKLQAAFKAEAEERLSNISSGLFDLEKLKNSEEQMPILEEIFREAHSLKGAARAVNFTDVESMCQQIESVFSSLKKLEISTSPELFDSLHYSLEVIDDLMTLPDQSHHESLNIAFNNLENIRGELCEKQGIVCPEIKLITKEEESKNSNKEEIFEENDNSFEVSDNIETEEYNNDLENKQKDEIEVIEDENEKNIIEHAKPLDQENKKEADENELLEKNKKEFAENKALEKNLEKISENNLPNKNIQGLDKPLESYLEKNFEKVDSNKQTDTIKKEPFDKNIQGDDKSLENDLEKELEKVDSNKVSETVKKEAFDRNIQGVDKKNKDDIDEKSSEVTFKSKIKSQVELTNQKEKPLVGDTVRISVSKLDSLMLKAEELVSLKLSARQHIQNLNNTIRSFDSWKKYWASFESNFRWLRRQASKSSDDNISHHIKGLYEFLQWNQDHIKTLEHDIKTLTGATEKDQRSLSAMIDDVLEDMKKVTMLPFSTLSMILPRMVRELSRNQQKDVELIINGSELEIDRRILEEMKDPIIHILRNSIDHGLETPEKRKKNNKNPRGIINMNISQNLGNKVEIIIADNGKGIDTDRVKEEAISRGMLSDTDLEKLNENEIMQLIFRSELSTSPIITEISGRGLGLAIVQEKVQQLGGTLTVDSEKGKGTVFIIQLPVTLATSRGILIRVHNFYFIVSVTHIERVIRVKQDDVKTVEGKATIPYEDGVMSFVDLSEVLKISKSKTDQNKEFLITVMILNVTNKKIAFRVDEVLGEQEVLVKSLGKQLSRVRNIAGATILGSGKVVPILNVHDLIKSSTKAGVRTPGTKTSDNTDTIQKSILVAEDSITSRMLIQNILESAGYKVQTAVDGYDAFSLFKSEEFDLVVSDVEMPRMTGFELTSQIRSHSTGSETPVIIITSLQSEEDKKKGVDAGADAYIVKSSFDQTNLLEVVERLI